MSTLERAIAIAAKAHGDKKQIDKAGAPYVLHPLRMMMKVPPGDAQIVAVLHDVVEDTGVSMDDLRQEGFSETVLDALASVTKITEDEDYTKFVLRAAANPIGRVVKLADLHDNCDESRISNPTQRDHDRIAKYKQAIQMIAELPAPGLASSLKIFNRTKEALGTGFCLVGAQRIPPAPSTEDSAAPDWAQALVDNLRRNLTPGPNGLTPAEEAEIAFAANNQAVKKTP